MSVLVIGAKGLVGNALGNVLPDAILWDREELDVTNFANIHAKFPELNGKVSAVINCVAYNDVDGAEQNLETAMLLNAKVPAQLALFANALRVPLVHFSTGYVFDGEKNGYVETDIPNPLSAYGKSKLAGEKAVEEQGGRYYIVRTNVVFGLAGTSVMSKKSFVDKVLELSKTVKDLKFVDDEINSITYAPDLATVVVKMLQDSPTYGVYHVVNEGAASWYDFGKEVLKGREDVTINTIKSSDLPRPAKRPRYSVLQSTKLPNLRSWQGALEEYLSIS